MFAVFALSTLAIEVDASRWKQAPTLIILALGAAAVLALLASADQVLGSEWLFAYDEPPRLLKVVLHATGGDPDDGLLVPTAVIQGPGQPIKAVSNSEA